MNKDKKIIVVLVFIIIVLVVGIFAFMAGKNYKQEKSAVVENNLPKEDKNSCDTGYGKTAESKVVLEESPTLITGFGKKCDGNYYFMLDYLSIGENNPNSGGVIYTNTNTKLREFKADFSLKVKTINNGLVPLAEYIGSFRQMEELTYNQAGVYYGQGGQPVFYANIKNGILVGLAEVYQP
ncbi:MAG: hypothetical protein WCI93_02115 [bacterium]